MTENLPTVTILGVAIHRVDVAGMLAQIAEWLAAPPGPCRQVCTVNPEFIVDAGLDPTFAAALARADLRVPDGVGVLWAAGRLGAPLKERVTGSDGIYHLCAAAAAHGWRVFLLGAGPGVADRAADKLAARYPGLAVVGTYGGSPADADWPAIRERLAAARPDLLFVAYGHPRQDLWIDRHRGDLPARVAIGIGGALDFVAGTAQRAPTWVQRWGLEWLHRLIRQPWRWRRMIKLPVFVWRVLQKK
jgi:N-acetylglucosaminyldiphosphoundecaprenol N-acetyl-beta-D-mannosaminyltransferase